MEQFETKKLYIVKPSIVTYDNTEYISKTNGDVTCLHTVILKNNAKDIAIAYKNSGCLISNIEDGELLYEGISFHCDEGDRYVGVIDGDIEHISKALYQKNKSLPKWNYELEKYLISLKPYYDKEELMKILKQLKEEIEETKEIEINKTICQKTKVKKIPVRFTHLN